MCGLVHSVIGTIGLLFGGVIAVGGVMQSSRSPAGNKLPYIILTGVYALLALSSLLGIIGAIMKKLGLIKAYFATLTVLVILSVASGAFSLYRFFEDAPILVLECIGNSTDSTVSKKCHDSVSILKGIIVGVFIFVCLIEICELVNSQSHTGLTYGRGMCYLRQSRVTEDSDGDELWSSSQVTGGLDEMTFCHLHSVANRSHFASHRLADVKRREPNPHWHSEVHILKAAEIFRICAERGYEWENAGQVAERNLSSEQRVPRLCSAYLTAMEPITESRRLASQIDLPCSLNYGEVLPAHHGNDRYAIARSFYPARWPRLHVGPNHSAGSSI
ncbi:hypothetical protein C8R47DRAFT_1084229 [Mycena vitilis]|nr:hypothetical protein C8R47DRAFT_1084229 [Mycena vitilis]